MTIARVLALATVLLAASVPAEGQQAERLQALDRLEQEIVLPPGAYPLSTYSRYYTFEDNGFQVQIKGYYVQGGIDPPGRYLRPSPVIVADGGCSAITIFFNPKAGIVDARCNGRA